MSQLENTKMEQPVEHEKITMVLLGKNSNDKNMVGNNILKAERFTAEKDTCTRVEEKVGNQIICIINTPELFYEQNATQETDHLEELKPQYAGERAFLLVLQDKQLSQEDTEMFTQLKVRFGDKMVENTVVVLVSNEKKQNREAYNEADANLKKLLDECGQKMSIHNRNEGMRDNELTRQVTKNWKRIYEKQNLGASNVRPPVDRVYEEIDQYSPMGAAQQVSGNSKEQTVHTEDQLIMTLVLLGMNSNNKSLIGNIILNKDRFQSKEIRFCEKIVDNVDSQELCIINTPDSFHKTSSEYDSMEELKPSYTGPRVFLLVLESKEVSPEEMEMFNGLKKKLGGRIVKNTVVMFERQSSNSMDKRITFNEKCRIILTECGSKKCVYYKNMKNDELIQNLKKHIESMQNNQTSESEVTRRKYDDIATMQTPVKSEQTGQTSEDKHEMTVVLLGKYKDNKCLIGNMIFNKDHFRPETVTCEKIVDNVNGQKVCIINTTDSFHKESSEDNSMDELKPSYTGPRVFLLVLKSKKLSGEEIDMYKDVKKKFGERMVKNTIVMVEKKGHSTSKEKKALSNSMERQLSLKGKFQRILNECGNRKCVYHKDMKNVELITELKKYTESMQQQQQQQQTSESDIVRAHRNIQTTQVPVQEGKMKPITIVLLGQTGSGKSASGNTILKKHHFESHASSVPVTKECQVAEETVYETRIRVIDTPDFFNEDLKNQAEQIKRCRELAEPGPDVYLLVMQLGRFTDGEREVLTHLKREFGDDVTSKMMILFTGKEKLKDRSLMDYISGSDKELQELVKACQSKCCALNNNEKGHHQAKKFLESLADMQGNFAIGNYNRKKHKDNKDCSIL